MSYRLTVIGTGYLGATHAACMADLGFEVLGLDVDEERIARLAAGDLPFFEPGLEPVLRRGLESGRLRFTSSYKEAADFGDVHFLCVGTPQKAGEYAADLAFVDDAVNSLAPLLERPCLVVGKSTVPVGTAARLAETMARTAPVGGTPSSPGTPSSCGRASPSRTRCTRTGSSSACRPTRAPPSTPRRCCGRSTGR